MTKTIRRIIRDSTIMLLLIAAATALGWIFSHLGFQETNVVVAYILSVLLVARFTSGYVYGILATLISLGLFNWFFTEPYFTLKVNDPTYVITFIIISVTAVITSALTSKAKEAAREAREKEAESNALYKLTNLLTDAEDQNAIASISVRTVSSVLNCDAAFICFTEDGEPEQSYLQQRGEEQIHRELHNGKELKIRMEQLHSDCDTDKNDCNYPVYGRNSVLGVLRIPMAAAETMTDSQKRMIHAIIESVSLALERMNSLRAQAKSREEATQEHYRGNLLRAISHDIRTPLSGIMGSAEMLMDMTEKEDPRYEVAFGVYQDADWLHSLVENILNLTKLHDGRLNIAKEPEAAEEVVAASVMVIEKRFPGRNIAVSMPEKLVLVPMDAKLISQVLVNLLDNAVKHTEENQEIRVSVEETETAVWFSVSDQGKGISEGDLPNVFQMFYTNRGKSTDSQRGIGLGLSICQSIVEAHGGTIAARNREEGGAEFSFTLPLQEVNQHGNEK